MTYTVKYKTAKQMFWKKIKKVKGDGLVETGTHRFFITENESRVEIPMQDMLFQFSNERFLLIKQNMEKESGQTINLHK